MKFTISETHHILPVSSGLILGWNLASQQPNTVLLYLLILALLKVLWLTSPLCGGRIQAYYFFLPVEVLTLSWGGWLALESVL